MAKATPLQIHLPPDLEIVFNNFIAEGGYKSRSRAGVSIVELGLGVSSKTVLELPVQLRKKILSHLRDNNFETFEEAVISMLELAARIIDNSKSKDEEGATNREIMEETLKRLYRINELLNVTHIDVNKIKEPDSSNQKTIDTMVGIVSRADKKLEEFLLGNVKE